MGSFAKSLGSSQPATSLDLSYVLLIEHPLPPTLEPIWLLALILITSYSVFPSLSGAPQQSQTQNPGQMVWANASQRAGGHTPVQRQQHPSTSQPPSRASQNQSHHVQQPQAPHEDMFPSGAQFANRLDDFRNGGQGINSQLAAGSQPQTGNIDEFPPLGRNVAPELAPARRDSLIQNTGFRGYNSGMICMPQFAAMQKHTQTK